MLRFSKSVGTCDQETALKGEGAFFRLPWLLFMYLKSIHTEGSWVGWTTVPFIGELKRRAPFSPRGLGLGNSPKVTGSLSVAIPNHRRLGLRIPLPPILGGEVSGGVERT